MHSQREPRRMVKGCVSKNRLQPKQQRPRYSGLCETKGSLSHVKEIKR